MRILIIGGYGNFGARITRALSSDGTIDLLIGGRNKAQADRLCEQLFPIAQGTLDPVELHTESDDLTGRITELRPGLVIHTAGPFQGQDFAVAKACLDAGAHYIDLADGRDFVCHFNTLDEQARERGLLLVTGASTLPGVSSAVVDEFLPRFDSLYQVAINIMPAQRIPRGLATLQAVLGYCGMPFERYKRGSWETIFGWQDLHRARFPRLGTRWLGNCDVPDLQLFPERYPGLETCTFQAGLELSATQWALWSLAGLRRANLVPDPARFARCFRKLAEQLDRFGTDAGGMQITLRGTLTSGEPGSVVWDLYTGSGHGPEIPCIPAIVLARKLATGALRARGAMPCMGLMTLSDFDDAIQTLDIQTTLSELSE